eukprot:4265247-Pleurochrysis_carterae.AAC.1
MSPAVVCRTLVYGATYQSADEGWEVSRREFLRPGPPGRGSSTITRVSIAHYLARCPDAHRPGGRPPPLAPASPIV